MIQVKLLIASQFAEYLTFYSCNGNDKRWKVGSDSSSMDAFNASFFTWNPHLTAGAAWRVMKWRNEVAGIKQEEIDYGEGVHHDYRIFNRRGYAEMSLDKILESKAAQNYENHKSNTPEERKQYFKEEEQLVVKHEFVWEENGNSTGGWMKFNNECVSIHTVSDYNDGGSSKADKNTTDCINAAASDGDGQAVLDNFATSWNDAFEM